MAVELIRSSATSSDAKSPQDMAETGHDGVGLRSDRGAGQSPKQNSGAGAMRRLSYGALVKHAPFWVELGLLAFLCLIAARFVWLIIAPLPAPNAPPKVASVPLAVQVLAPANPFKSQAVLDEEGDASAAANTSDDGAAPDVRETSLDLKLFGVWLSGDTSSATIQTPNKKQSVYRIGDTVWDNVTLDSVYANQVILNSGGFLEALKLPNKVDYDLGANAPNLSKPQNSAVPSGDDALEGNGEETQQAAQDLDRSKVDANEDGLRSSLSEMVRFRPARDSQGAPALALFPGDNGAAFDAQGLKEGDLLVSVDGVSVSGGASAIAALRRRFDSGQDSFAIIVERGDALVDLTIAVTQ